MPFSLQSLQRPGGDTVYYHPAFRTVIETHLTFLRYHPNTTVQIVADDLAYQFEGDLYGLLASMGIPLFQHWIIMRVNRMENPAQFGVDQDRTHPIMLHFPDDAVISDLKKQFLTTQR